MAVRPGVDVGWAVTNDERELLKKLLTQSVPAADSSEATTALVQ